MGISHGPVPFLLLLLLLECADNQRNQRWSALPNRKQERMDKSDHPLGRQYRRIHTAYCLDQF